MRDSIAVGSAKCLRRYIFAAIFFSGAAVLSLEIAGTRLISPLYGTSVWCWSALITVTLAALAVGYRLGGRRADREPGPASFIKILGTAAAVVALIPALRFPALKLSAHLGPKVGALAAAALLVAPALALLSALGPAAIKLTASGKADVGGASGDVYAVSTLGSMAGALATALTLVPHVALSHILYGVSVVLLLLYAWGSLIIHRKTDVALMVATAIGFCCARAGPAPPAYQRLLKESLYAQIEVRDDDGKRELFINNQRESGKLAERGASPYPGLELAAILRPNAQKALVVGVGGGSLSTSLEANYGVMTDNVEIDADVASAAKEYFRFAPRGGIFIEDGRSYLERGGPPYDLMFIDAYKTDTVPYDLFTEEAFAVMRGRLRPNGILGINFVTSADPRGQRAWASVYKTLRGVFPEVRAFTPYERKRGLVKIYFFCSDGKFPRSISWREARPWVRNELRYMLSHELHPSESEYANAYRLTDDFTPLDSLLAENSMLRRRAILAKISARDDQ